MDENSTVGYCNNTVFFGEETSHDGTTLEWNYYETYPEVREWYPLPPYYGTTKYEDVYKKAFNIAKLLLKKKLLKSRKLKDFIGLVEEIAKEI